MKRPSLYKDLIVLVADKNMESSVRGLLSRHQALGTPPIVGDFYVHPERDPGCLLRGHDFIRPFQNRYSYALVRFDLRGCGRENDYREKLEEEVENRLAHAGWHARSAAIVIQPELEIWVWANSPHVERVLGWQTKTPGLRSWLRQADLLPEGSSKPTQPKYAMEEALRLVKKPRSSALYLQLAQLVTLDGVLIQRF